MSAQLYRHIVAGNVNFDYYLRLTELGEGPLPDGTRTERDTSGRPVGFFVQVSPSWGQMYDGDTLYRRSAVGGIADQGAGFCLERRLFSPVRPSDLMIVKEFSNGEITSETVNGFTTLAPGRYTVVEVRDPPGIRRRTP